MFNFIVLLLQKIQNIVVFLIFNIYFVVYYLFILNHVPFTKKNKAFCESNMWKYCNKKFLGHIWSVMFTYTDFVSSCKLIKAKYYRSLSIVWDNMSQCRPWNIFFIVNFTVGKSVYMQTNYWGVPYKLFI